MVVRCFLQLAAGLLGTLWLAGLATAQIVTDDIAAALARDGQARVIVEMTLPDEANAARTLEREAALNTTRNPEALRTRAEAALARQRAAVAAGTAGLRGELALADMAMEMEFDNLPMFVTTVTAEKLERLARMPGVRAIYLDKPVARRLIAPQAGASVMLEAVPAESPDAEDNLAATESTERAERTAAATEDAPEKALLSSTVTYIKADTSWARGFTGKGQAVVIADDGIDRNHEMFTGKIVAEACYSVRGNSSDVALCPGGATSSTATGAASNCSAAANLCAHGSHVAGIAAGNDTTGSTTLRGVAYEAALIPIQVFTLVNDQDDCDNKAPCLLSYGSATLSALNFAISEAAAQKVAAVNLSLGGEPVTGACDTDVRKPAIDTLRGLGVLTAIAAGNDAKVGQVTPPSCISTSVTTSSTIITLPDTGVNHAANVDVLAPGVLVRSAGLNNTYVTRSGTSMATPHAAGAIAVLKSAKPTATASEIETALKTGGISTTNSAWTWSTPRLDINKSLDLLGVGGAVAGVVVPGVYSSNNPSADSYLRFFNPTQVTGTVTVQMYDDITGAKVGTWIKSIPGYAALQFNMDTIEAEASPVISSPASTSQFYTLFVEAPFTGYAQHVLWNPQTAALTNVSGCDVGLSDNGTHIGNVHTSLIANYTSYLSIHNAGSTEAKPSFDVRDARNGLSVGTFTTSANIKPHTTALVKVSTVLETLGKTPDSGQFHVNFLMNTGFTGFAQHLVDNEIARVITNMTGKCDI